MRGSPKEVARLLVGFALIHSVLASRGAKGVARRLVGARYANGLYRFLFIVQSLVLTLWGGWRLWKLPDRVLYRVPAPLSWLMIIGQLCSLGVVLSAVREIGVLQALGVAQLWTLLRGGSPTPPPAAQGPRLGADGEMVVSGAFRFMRHPANWGAWWFFLLMPVVTVNWATLTLLSSVYFILGSWHEEYRLLKAYGAPYGRYQGRVPFLLAPFRPLTGPISHLLRTRIVRAPVADGRDYEEAR